MRNGFVGVGGKSVGIERVELKIESEFKLKKYNPRLLLENELEFMVRFPPSAYKPVEAPSSLLLLERKMFAGKVVLAELNLAP